MKFQKQLVGLTAIFLLSSMGTAFAGKCGGTTARVYAKPVVVHKAADGSQTMHMQSTGTSIQTMGPNASPTGNWQHCTGFWTVKGDKSGSGSGICLFINQAGDQYIISWDGGNEGGTWKSQSGTGMFASLSETGTWRPGRRFPDGLTTATWESDCGN